jgi:Ca2+-transporting ATPase
MLKLIIAYNHECKRTDDGRTIGDPTEIALLSAAFPEGFPEIDRSRVFCFLPFDSSRKMMSIGIIRGERKLLLVKGSPENILEKASYVMKSDGILVEAEQVKSDIYKDINLLAEKGLRTIGFAFKEVSDGSEIEEKNLTFVGLSALIDPPRPEVREAIQECYSAGIRVSMITGDHPLTARRIAEEVGLRPIKRVINGTELAEMPMDQFEEIVESVTVYARVDPEQKLKIVNALKDKGHVVAMTGDGVNDAPALKRADIGIAMGITGTEVARESADMILLDDNFATIVKAVREGRRIYENIRKFIKYTMGSNTGEIVSIVFAPLLGLPIPIKPVHILWINLVTDGLPGIAMAFEKEEPDIMKQPPRPLNESIFARNLGWHIIWVGFLLGLNTLLSYQLSNFFGWEREATTIAFTVLCLSQLGHALAIRSNKYSTFSIGFFSNRLLIFSIALTFGLQLALIYLPFLNRFFKTVPLSLEQLLFSIGISTLIFISVEIEKWLIRRFNFYEQLKNLRNKAA